MTKFILAALTAAALITPASAGAEFPSARELIAPLIEACQAEPAMCPPVEVPPTPPPPPPAPAPTADAPPQAPEPSTIDPIHMPMIESLEPVAEAYWALRGITLPGPVEVFLIADEPGVGARGQEPGDRVWLTQSVVEFREEGGRLSFCELYLHERGHNAGLAHFSGDPVMDANPSNEMKAPIPKCIHWAMSGFKRALGAHYSAASRANR